MNKANYSQALLHWKAQGISGAQALSLAEKQQLLNTAVLDMVFGTKPRLKEAPLGWMEEPADQKDEDS